MKLSFKIISPILLVSVLVFFAGFYINGKLLCSESNSVNKAYEEGRTAMMDELNPLLLTRELIRVPLDTSFSMAANVTITTLYGFVKEIKQGSFILDYDTSQFDTLNGTRQVKEVIVNDTTNIVKAINKPKQAGDGNAETVRNIKLVPSPVLNQVHEEAIAFSDLKYGDYVQIITATDVQQTGNSITATDVRVQSIQSNPYLESGEVNYEELPLSLSVSAARE